MAPYIPRILCFLLLGSAGIPGGQPFFPNFWTKFLSLTWYSFTHQDITENAILNITLQILLDNKHPTRPPLRIEDFQGKTLVADDILRAYFGEEASARQFRASMQQIVNANSNMDFLNGTRNDPLYHFDSERLVQGNILLLSSRDELMVAMRAKDYEGSRERLGQMLHSLQDFYSHTNWVELGNTEIHPNLATPGRQITSLAGASEQTCKDCTGESCRNNLADFVQQKHLLTSGYFGETPKKPQGKCSHGGPFDGSSQFSARGGINKDTSAPLFSPHYLLHVKAAKLALQATIKFLSELRRDITDREMLRLLGVSYFPTLSFVLDTTGSMGEEITAVRIQARRIIERQRLLPPDYYILVPFNDPEFGPVFKTSNPDEFLKYLNTLNAFGGGDEPEMCLSALQLALIDTPPHSEIFVFTDASAKDMELRSSVEALIQERKIKVSFLITEDPSRTIGRSRRELLSQDRFDIYSQLSMTSGGQMIFTNNEDIRSVSEVIAESVHFDMVKLLHVQSEERKFATHVLEVDRFLRNVSLYLNGIIQEVQIEDPSGHIQYGKLHRNGKLTRIFLSDPLPVGNWSITVLATGPYSLHVQGRSSVDFLYCFGAPIYGSHPGLYKYTNQPVAGVPAVLVVEAIGLPRTAQLEVVSLTSAQGETQTFPLENSSLAGFLVAQVGHTPIGNFLIGVSGQDSDGHAVHRKAPQHGKAAECEVEMSAKNRSAFFPGIQKVVSLNITNHGSPDCFTINLSSSNGSVTVTPAIHRLQIGKNERQTLDFTVEAPVDTKVKTCVTVIAEAKSCENVAKSCIKHHVLMVEEKPEATPPTASSCTNVTYSGSCPRPPIPKLCHGHPWTALLWVSVPHGVKSVQVPPGSGSISHDPTSATNGNVMLMSDCCSSQVDILVTNSRGQEVYCHLDAPSTSTALGPSSIWVLLLVIICVYAF
ncbi:von Willebrand factor A domain-containing protein 7 [Pelodytes ibericus]